MASCTFSIEVSGMDNADLEDEERLAMKVYTSLKDVKLNVPGTITDCQVLDTEPDEEEEDEED